MEDFYKRKDGEYLEGYLGPKEDFNGIVFMLKEPNQAQVLDENEDERIFWFKNVLYGERIYKESDSKKDKRRSKTAATKYKKRFQEMLRQIGYENDDLKNAIYCNVHPEWGSTHKSEEYDSTKYLNVVKKMKLLESCAKKMHSLTIFTCMDIYDILKNLYKKNGFVQENEKGLIYKRGGEMGMFKVKTEVSTISVYKILHPSYGSGLKVEDDKSI